MKSFMNYNPLEKILGYTFADKKILTKALTHPSSGENDNERLEFFGDAVVEFIISEYLFASFTDRSEGDLTEYRSHVVCRETLAEVVHKWNIREYIIMGKGISQRPELPVSVYANLFEALAAAVYLDGGINDAREFIMRHLREIANHATSMKNYKSMLQEISQKNSGEVPAYKVEGESGPAHKRRFTVSVSVHGKKSGMGEGNSKKEAEQAAAQAALERLEKNDK